MSLLILIVGCVLIGNSLGAGVGWGVFLVALAATTTESEIVSAVKKALKS